MSQRKTIKIVIVEDDSYYNKVLTKYVTTICNPAVYPSFDFEIKSFSNAHDCIGELEDDTTIMILDYYLVNDEETDVLNGADVLAEVNKHCANCKVIMVSSLKNAHIATELVKQGIYEYVDKNVNSRDRIGAVLQRALSEEIVA